FVGNTVAGDGGAVWIGAACKPRFVNCTIASNSADGVGGGVTVSGNSFANSRTCSLVNCIIWGNVLTDPPLDGPTGAQLALVGEEDSDLVVATSDVQGGQADVIVSEDGTLDWQAGNIDEVPQFQRVPDPGNDDFCDLQLHFISACLNRGNADAIPVDIY